MTQGSQKMPPNSSFRPFMRTSHTVRRVIDEELRMEGPKVTSAFSFSRSEPHILEDCCDLFAVLAKEEGANEKGLLIKSHITGQISIHFSTEACGPG